MSDLGTRTNEVISSESAEDLLRPYLPALRRCIESGWQAWENLGNTEADLRRPLSNRTRAAFVYDHIVHCARGAFDGKPGVTIKEKLGFLTINFDGRVLIRFKKFDKKRRTNNIPTRQQRLFSLQASLPGLEDDSTRLNAGYVLNALQIGISEIAITCPKGNDLEWWFAVVESTSEEPTILHPAAQPEPDPSTRVRVRATAEKTETP